MWPVPADDRLHIENPGSASARLELRDATGRIISEQTLPAGIGMVELEHVPNGTYLVTLVGSEGRTTRQLMIAH
jgi:hypothetical protein